MDLRLTSAHDLDFGSGRHIVDGVEAIAQHLLIVLRLVLGEFFTAADRGMPIYDVLGKGGMDDDFVRAAVRDVALTVPGVLDVTDIELTRNTQTRTLSITAHASVEGGGGLTVTI